MIIKAPRILIGDQHDKRFERFKTLLAENFRTGLDDIVQASNFQDLLSKARTLTWDVIFIADDLQEVKDKVERLPVESHLYRLEEVYQGSAVCVVTNSFDPQPLSPERVISCIHFPYRQTTKEARNAVAEIEIAAPNLKKSVQLPKIELEGNDPALREQLRTLSDRRSLREGKNQLAWMLSDLFECESVVIGKLGQGKSGSRVFRVTPSNRSPRLKAREIGDYVLKVTPNKDVWKLRSEVAGHILATALLRPDLDGDRFTQHATRIEEPRQSIDDTDHHLRYAVSHNKWLALCYKFLGKRKKGRFVDLETMLIAAPDDLDRRISGTDFESNHNGGSTAFARKKALDETLRWLSALWYKALSDRVPRPLWDCKDRPTEQYPELPPYQLSGNSKEYIIGFLDSRDAEMGKAFFDKWKNRVELVQRFVERSRNGTERVFKRQPVVVSPVHGDLNTKNVLLWLDKTLSLPFLIDFAMFQELGHTLQDFAKLETEVKFSIMDRQEGAPVQRLPAADHTYSQIFLWKQLEDHLLGTHWRRKKDPWSKAGYKANVEECLCHIQLIRGYAEQVQLQDLRLKPTQSFLDEYRPALMFHTLKAIGYEDLPVFKRLLAIYSASSLLWKVGIK